LSSDFVEAVHEGFGGDARPVVVECGVGRPLLADPTVWKGRRYIPFRGINTSLAYTSSGR
jgi:hypothetical protein